MPLSRKAALLMALSLILVSSATSILIGAIITSNQVKQRTEIQIENCERAKEDRTDELQGWTEMNEYLGTVSETSTSPMSGAKQRTRSGLSKALRAVSALACLSARR